MKIAIFHELHKGGARKAANEFAKRLKKNHVVDLYLVDEELRKEEKPFFNSVFLYTFISKKWSGGNWKTKLFKDTVELYKLYKLHKQIAQKINEGKYDIVLIFPSQFTQAPFLLRFLHSKKIYFCMEPLRLAYDSTLAITKKLDVFRSSYEKINRQIRKIIDRKNVSYTQICIAPSKYLAGLFAKIYNKPVKTVYCGVDVEFFKRDEIKKDIDILFVGSKSYYDGYHFLKEVLQQLKSKVTVKEILSENDWLTNVEMRDVFRRSRIFVALSHNEPLGLIPLEVMSCETPVIAINEAGYKETVIDGKTGYLVKRDAQKVADKITWLLAHQNRLAKMGREGRKIMEETWTWDICAQRLESVIKQVLRG